MKIKDNISLLNNCYGCGVCVPACPKKIIELSENENGFYRPIVSDQDRCIECGICLDVCAFNHSELALEEETIPTAYAGWSKNSNVRQWCSSGGIGFEIGKFCIEKGMKACGVRYDTEKNRALHYIASTTEEFMPSVGSKYIPSYTAEGFKEIDRKSQYIVTGTPCQIDSFRRYIKRFKVEDNFILLDFFCHGVPSLLLWDKYLAEVEKPFGKPTFVSWRNKSTGWHDSWAVSVDSDGNAGNRIDSYNLSRPERIHQYQSKLSEGDLFFKFFLGNYCLNDCCYKCKYKALHSSADIRIGDAWGKNFASDDDGISAILILTQRGEDIITALGENCTVIPDSVENIIDGQMRQSPIMPWIREIILNRLRSKNSMSIIYNSIVIPYRISLLPKRILRKLLKITNTVK